MGRSRGDPHTATLTLHARHQPPETPPTPAAESGSSLSASVPPPFARLPQPSPSLEPLALFAVKLLTGSGAAIPCSHAPAVNTRRLGVIAAAQGRMPGCYFHAAVVTSALHLPQPPPSPCRRAVAKMPSLIRWPYLRMPSGGQFERPACSALSKGFTARTGRPPPAPQGP